MNTLLDLLFRTSRALEFFAIKTWQITETIFGQEFFDGEQDCLNDRLERMLQGRTRELTTLMTKSVSILNTAKGMMQSYRASLEDARDGLLDLIDKIGESIGQEKAAKQSRLSSLERSRDFHCRFPSSKKCKNRNREIRKIIEELVTMDQVQKAAVAAFQDVFGTIERKLGGAEDDIRSIDRWLEAVGSYLNQFYNQVAGSEDLQKLLPILQRIQGSIQVFVYREQ